MAETTPWLALVLIAEGEAELRLNQDVGACVSADVHLDGERDVAKGNCLVVRQSILEKILPSRKDVPLLAHARQVDIHDTELMMGDDDGFLSVVISNRLPVAGVDATGEPTPVKYLACLINLEGQFHRLIPEAPPPQDHLELFSAVHSSVVYPAVYDHVVSGGLEEHWNTAGVAATGQVHVAAPHADAPHAAGPHAAGPLAANMAVERNLVESAGPAMQAYTAKTGWSQESKHDVYETMAEGFRKEIRTVLDPQYTFPCLLHWSFVSTGSTTFETLMRELDSGLSGSLPQDPPPPATHKRVPPTGREPLEVVETGHVGLVQRTRRGDSTRSWYRGPLLAHPSSGERLPIAHASDQLRAVIPDGREDISLAAAFEVGRLLALSKPAMVAALMRWRQAQFQAARSGALWEHLVDRMPFELDRADIRTALEGKLRSLITTDPEQFIGAHRPLVTPGDPVDWGANPLTVLGRGLGLEVDLGRQLREVGDFAGVTGVLRTTVPPVIGDLSVRGAVNPAISETLLSSLDTVTEQMVSNVLANEIAVDPGLGAGVIRTPDVGTVVRPSGAATAVNTSIITAITTGILNVRPGGGPAGGFISGGLGVPAPHAEPRAETATGKTRRRRTKVTAVLDPLDELLHPARTGTTPAHTTPERRSDS